MMTTKTRTIQICERGEVCWERPGSYGNHLCWAAQSLLHGDHHLDEDAGEDDAGEDDAGEDDAGEDDVGEDAAGEDDDGQDDDAGWWP